MISACSSGYDGQAAGSRAKLSDWSRTFPNLKTAWGYASENGEYHSPSQVQAVMHINAWEQATRGRVEDVHAKQSIDQYFIQDNVRDKPQFDGNVSTWTAARGYVEGKG